MNNFYLYAHIRPDTGTIFYVGIGDDKSGEYQRAYIFSTNKRNALWEDVYISNNKKIGVIIILDKLSKEDAIQEEINLIKKIGRVIDGSGQLVNIGKGGEHPDREGLKIGQYDLDGNLVKIWDSVNEIVSKLKIPKSNIYNNAAGITKKCKNFYWKFIINDEVIDKIDVSKFKYKSSCNVYQYSLYEDFIRKYQSIAHASKISGIEYSAISHAISERRYSAGGFIWRNKKESVDIYLIIQLDKNYNWIATYLNVEQATKSLRLNTRTSIKRCINNPTATAYGFKWLKIRKSEAIKNNYYKI